MVIIENTNKILNVFNKNEKLIFFTLIIMQVILAFLELLSIASFLPLLQSITDKTWLKSNLNFISETDKTFFLFFVIFILFLAKFIFVMLLNYFQIVFRNKVSLRVVSDVYESFLKKKYEFHLKNHSSILLRNLQQCNNIDRILLRIVTFYSDFILFLVTVAVAFFLNYKISIVFLIFATLIIFVYYKFTSKNIEKYGTAEVKFQANFLKNLLEGLKSFKEIIITGNHDFFLKRNRNFKIEAMKNKMKFTLIDILPKYLLELLIVSLGLIFLWHITYKLNYDLIYLFPFLGVIALTIFKLMPNFLRLYSGLQNFKYLGPQIDIIEEALKKLDEEIYFDNKKINVSDNSLVFREALSCKNLSFNYQDKNILKNINFEIKKNTVVGIKGESGSGKSTLLNLITGLLVPQKGSFYIDGNQVKLNNLSWIKKISYVFQNTHLIDASIKDNIAFGVATENLSEEKLKRCITISGLSSYVSNLPDGMDTIIGEKGSKISGGQAQRIGIARAFYSDPEILILDEATASLDSENENKILSVLQKMKHNLTIIIVSHNEVPLRLADKIYNLKDNELFKIN